MASRSRWTAAAVLVATAGLARARRVGRVESAVFGWVNRASDVMRGPAWIVMQAGSLGAVVVTARAARRQPHSWSAPVLVTGFAAWTWAKLVKPIVGRGRPSALLDGVHVRGAAQSGLGYPSGHAAVATALALASTPAGGWRRWISLAVAGGAGTARVYVGAHLPLDVVGGVAGGVVLGSMARRRSCVAAVSRRAGCRSR